MSWHTSGIAVKSIGALTDEKFLSMLGLGPLTPGEEVDFDEAGSSDIEGLAIGKCGEWALAFNPSMFLSGSGSSADWRNSMWPPALEKRLIGVSKDFPVFGLILEGTSGTADFSFYRSGKRERCFMVQEGKTVFEQGQSLKEEKEAFSEESDPEQRILLLAEKLGLDFNSEIQMEMAFRLYEFGDEVPDTSMSPRNAGHHERKWWQFWR